MSTTLACPPPCAAPWPSASVRQQALQRTAHWALLGRLAVGSAQERGSCGTPREQSGDQTRRYARGHAAPRGPRARRDARSCAHHRDGIPASGTRSSPSTGAGGGAAPRTARGQPAAGHGAPPRCGASDAVPPAVLLRAARGGLLPVPTRPCWWPGGGGGLTVAQRETPLTRMGPAVGTLFVVSACAGKRRGASRAAKEPSMRQPRTCSVIQRHASPADAQRLQHPWPPMPTRRASRMVSCVLGLALGTGVLTHDSDGRRTPGHGVAINPGV